MIMINARKMSGTMQHRVPMGKPMRSVSSTAVVSSAALFIAIFVFGLATSSAQSLGDLARQERERVRVRSAKSPHVFTNEDLSRPKILEAVELAQEAAQPATASAPANALAAPPLAPVFTGELQDAAPVWPAGTPLGNVARYYRQQKELRSAPPDAPAVAQSKPKVVVPRRRSSAPQMPLAPRQNTRKYSPEQPLQKPKKMIAETASIIRDAVPEGRMIRVNTGDSLWKLASRYLGGGNQWHLIAAANPEIADPERILAGQQIRIPGRTDAAAASNQIRVQPGDSLWKLAKAQWGTGQAWTCIVEFNPQLEDSIKIYPGQTLTLPVNCSTAI